jgi:hypothetical protein
MELGAILVALRVEGNVGAVGCNGELASEETGVDLKLVQSRALDILQASPAAVCRFRP